MTSYAVHATAALTDTGKLVLKDAESFAVLDRFGDINAFELRDQSKGEQGFYHKGTRHVSRLTLRLGGERLLLLSGGTDEDNLSLNVDLMNPEVMEGKSALAEHGSIHFKRSIFIKDGCWYERMMMTNYGESAVSLVFSLEFGADFRDLFEVRGTQRARRGTMLAPETRGGTAESHASTTLRYEGLDGIVRSTCFRFSSAPAHLDAHRADFVVDMAAHQSRELELSIFCETSSAHAVHETYTTALKQVRNQVDLERARECQIRSSSEHFNSWLERSLSDLRMLTVDTEQGPYPHAGIPWFSTPFGRDGIITAMQMLWVAPATSVGVLRYLAATQATAVDDFMDAEPGKIAHELRQGEMAALREVPFAKYYGSADATPLFVQLVAETYRRTGDTALLQELMPAVERALGWIDDYGDLDGDGFVEYRRRADTGLLQQGWKDSHNAIFHSDGEAAKGPIALCEVQGYVYAAKKSAAWLYSTLGEAENAALLEQEAEALRARFDKAFWSDEIGAYALALDGDKKPCQVRSSNAGHALFSGIAYPERAESVRDMLMSPDMFSGWGVRTLASCERRYSPMAYHNGSVWPHDNAIIAEGLARYGFKEDALSIFSGLFDASLAVEEFRLPELFCGFARQQGHPPTQYPVACAPQAWAAASICMVLKAVLGLAVCATSSVIEFRNARLPRSIEHMSIRALRIGDAEVDLDFRTHRDDVGITVSRRQGKVEVRSIK